MKVFINPGHAPNGAPDPGAVNKITGDRECDYALEGGRLLEGYLNAVGIETKVLQSDDLYEVCDASNSWGADIFISIHCNAFNTEARGTETLYKSFNGQRLANYIQSQIVRSVQDVVDRGVKQRNDLLVLNGTNAVAVLVEMAFIDNMEDLELLKTKLSSFARAMARGVTDYGEGI